MAGSFGYEKEHFDVSMKVGELVLLPTVRSAPADTIIAAPGTSCRHQIKDGTGRIAHHPAEILLRCPTLRAAMVRSAEPMSWHHHASRLPFGLKAARMIRYLATLFL